MAVLNVSFLNSKNRGSGSEGVGILADKLQILENELGKDGYLAPGDYDLLIGTASKIRNSGGLSSAQRSNYDVKISTYQKSKELSMMQSSDDLDKINREIKSEAAEDVMVAGNDPAKFLQGRAASLQAKLADLEETISRKELAGDDTTKYLNEYNDTLRQYSDRITALKDMQSFDGANPLTGYAAYVTTNNKGEIVDVDYDKYGAKSGYAETNGMINGFQVFGKVNNKKDGRNIFILGDKTFSAVDLLVADAANPGSFKPTKLVADATTQGPYSKGQAGYINVTGESLRIQSYLPEDSWAEGVDGTLYHRRTDGGYTKYINTKVEDLNIPGQAILRIPKTLETNLTRNIDQTVDGAEIIMPDEGINFAPEASQPLEGKVTPVGPMHLPTIAPEMNGAGQSYRTPQQPQDNTSPTTPNIFQRTVKSAGNFIKGIFG
jgi:hypothetical protein